MTGAEFKCDICQQWFQFNRSACCPHELITKQVRADMNMDACDLARAIMDCDRIKLLAYCNMPQTSEIEALELAEEAILHFAYDKED